MKILFTADLHIKLGQKNVPRQWQANRYRMLIEKLETLDFDTMVWGGDVFDKLPSLDEIQLYFELINKLTRTTVIYSGNHEAGKRGYTWLEKLKESTQSVNPLVHIVDGNTDLLPGIDIIDYKDLKTFNPSNYHNKILMTHVRGSIPPYVHPEIDLSKFKKWDIIYAGDLHDHSATKEKDNDEYNIVYPGSPLSCSFHRNPISNGVIIIDELDWEFIPLKLPQLIRKTITSEKEAVQTDYDHTIYEIKGNVEDLSNTSTGGLIDRKVVHSNKEAKLNMEGLTIQEELNLYLTEVMGIENTSEIIGVFNDHT